MLKHHLLLLYRNILRDKSHFFINVAGLTAGLSCTILIYLWVQDEYQMNGFHANDDRLFQVMEHQHYADEIMTTTSTPGVLAETLKEEFPEIAYAATTTWISPYTLSIGELNVKSEGYHVGKDFFQIFSFPLLQGQPEQVLADKKSMVISRALAQKLFPGKDDVVGQVIELEHEKSFKVSGVFENIPSRSSFRFDFVMSFEEYKDDNKWVLEWGNNGPSTFIVLRPDTDPRAFEAKIKDFVKSKDPNSHINLFIQKFSERYLFGKFENGKPAGGRIEQVQLFSIVAIVILIIACINFMNLSTARASRKVREVGIRKSVGAPRASLIAQYLTDSLMTTVAALLIALLIVWLILPQFNLLTDKQIVLELSNTPLLTMLILVTLITGLLAGSYPAFFLSGFRPSAVLKGEMKGSIVELWARRGLVVLQFASSVALIVFVLGIRDQIAFVQAKNLGYNKEQLISFPIEGKVKTARESFLTELQRIPGVVQASATSHSFLGRNNNTSGLEWEGKVPETKILFENISVDHGLLETLGVSLAAGRMFREGTLADTNKIIFNEAAIRVMNLKDPIGKHIKLWGELDLEIVGIVKDFHYQSLHDQVNPLFFRLNPKNTWTILTRLEKGKEKETLAAISDLYKQFNPGFTLDYKFQDQEYEKQYASEQRVGTLSTWFAIMAILISCLGLFGLAAFTAERRIKEIGIRKTLGSSVTSIVMMLSGDFTKIVLVAVCIGLPFSWFFLKQWLTRFAYQIDITAWHFALAGTMAILIAWITVAWQSLRAARLNPVKCLRSE